MKWTRKTKEFDYAPYISEDKRFRVQDINDQPTVPEYNELLLHNWDNEESHKAFMNYCKAHKISLHGSNWAVVDNRTDKVICFPFRTAKAAKQYAETL